MTNEVSELNNLIIVWKTNCRTIFYLLTIRKNEINKCGEDDLNFGNSDSPDNTFHVISKPE